MESQTSSLDLTLGGQCQGHLGFDGLYAVDELC